MSPSSDLLAHQGPAALGAVFHRNPRKPAQPQPDDVDEAAGAAPDEADDPGDAPLDLMA